MKHIRYTRLLLCCLLLSFVAHKGYAQIAITADSTGCSSTSVTLHGAITGNVPTASGITADDGYSGLIPIGFNFNFYGTVYTDLLFGSNGMLCFDASLSGSWDPWPISAPLLGNSSAYNAICGPWCDVYIPAGGTMTYSTIGTAPYRKFMATWCSTAMYDCTSQWLTTQIILYETTNIVETHIGHHTGSTCTYWNGGYAIVGVQNSDGSAATVAPGRDYPTVWDAINEAWRFTPDATVSSYAVSAITFAPVPYASSVISWYDSATGVYLGSGASITLYPTVPTTYVATAAGCSDSTFAYIHVLPPGGSAGGGGSVGLHITNSTFTNPTACGMCDGTITLHGVTPGQIDTLFYYLNGIPQTPTVHTAATDSTIVLSGLCAGAYADMYVKVGGCMSNPVYDTLTAPVLSVSGDVGSNPSICGDNDGTITIMGLFPYSTATVNMTWNGTPIYASGVTDGAGTLVLPGMYGGVYTGITVTIGLCSAIAPDLTLIDPPITAAFSTDVTHLGCVGDTLICTNLSTPPGFTSYWTFGDGSAVDSVDTNPMHIYASQGTYTVTLVYSTFHRCFDTVTAVINYNHPITSVFTPSASAVCVGTLMSFANSSIGLAPTTYAWTFGDGTTSTDASPIHTYTTGGTYNVVLNVTDGIGCTASSSTAIDVVEIGVRTQFMDTSVCLKDSMPLISYVTYVPASAVSGVTYSWAPTGNIGDPTSSAPNFMGIGNYTYTVTATAQPLGCVATAALSIHSYPPVTLTGLTADQSIPNGSSIQLNADGATYYTWTPDNGTLDNTNINNPMATPVDSVTTYVVHGMSLYGCLDTATITIHLDYGTDEFIPMAFTPNNDGLNDRFRVSNLKFHKLVDFRVFDRWGHEVFQTSNPEIGWDGTLNGTPQDLGVYSYQIIVAHPDGTQKVYTGNVTLLR